MALFQWKLKTDAQIASYVSKQHAKLESERKKYVELHELIVKIYRPRRYDILNQKGDRKGERFGARVFDQHPANALAKFVGGTIGYMVNRSIPWIQFVAPTAELMRQDVIKDYCQNAAEQILFATNRSNFYSSQMPHAMDAHSTGTSCVVPMTDLVRDRVMFDVVHPRDAYIGVDRYGEAIIFHRTLTLTHMVALELFTKDRLPTVWFNDDGELKELFQEAKFIWAIYPNGDRDTSSKLPVDRRYSVFCVLKGSKNQKGTTLVLRTGEDIFPICWRSLRESGSSYGTSLCADALTAALMCNKLAEKNLVAAHQAVEPGVIASSSLRAELMRTQMRPKSYTWVEDINREGVKKVLDRLDWPITDAQIERIHGELDTTFFIQFFEMLSNVDRKTKTAYEVSQMMGEKATLMSTIVDTYTQESIEPHINALFSYETAVGRMPDVPQALLDSTNGGTLSIRYLGPLAQLQRTLLQSKGIVDAISIIGQIAGIDESVVWKFDWPNLAEDTAIAQGMPQKRIFSDVKFQQIKDQIEEQKQTAIMAEMAVQGGKAMGGGLGKKPETGSPAEALMNQP